MCVDSWHHFRGTCDWEELAAIGADRVISIQINDGPAQPMLDDYLEDTLANRLVPGDGDFDLVRFVRSLDAMGVVGALLRRGHLERARGVRPRGARAATCRRHASAARRGSKPGGGLSARLRRMVIERVGVVGCGLMGSGIAEVCARAGLDVVVREASPEAAEAGLARITTSLDRATRGGKLDEAERDATLGRMRMTTDYGELADRQLVVEAVVEAEELKAEVFGLLDKVVEADDAVLASNTSSIPIMKLGMATRRPESVVGHPLLQPGARAQARRGGHVAAHRAGDDRAGRARSRPTSSTSASIRSQDRAGFIVNALLIPYLLSAIRMLESGFATAEDIDTGMVEGCAHPMGPLHLADLIGLDTTMAVAESLYAEFKEPLYASPPLLSRMVEAGLLGRKAGRGFYDYSRKSR